MIERALTQPEQALQPDDGACGGDAGVIATGALDRRAIVVALYGGLGFLVLGLLCLSLSRSDAALASVWLPNAAAVALLLLARLRNEIPAYAAIALASISANMLAELPPVSAMVFSTANIVEIALVTWLTRRGCRGVPNMTSLAHLGRFLQNGGVLGPVLSTLLAAFAMGPDGATIWKGAVSWFLAASMGQILIVPAVLLIAEALQRWQHVTRTHAVTHGLFMVGGLGAAYLVFKQDVYPLMFLVPPVTLLLAFRLGALGTAIYVPGVAIVASIMTHAGIGPIAQNATTNASEMYVIQAFVAANFLAGLPIAAILAGRARLTEQLTTGRHELDLLTNNITDAVLRLDINGICTYASPSVREVLGRAPDDFVGRLITARTHEEAADRIAAVLRRLLDGESDKERLTYRRLLDCENGNPVFIEADCAIAIDPLSGERSGIIVSARDVTDRVELELLLTRARRTAEDAARAKSEFLANMSHEIRTPMNGVLGFAELMLQGDLDEEQQRHTEMIVQSGRSMMLLLNDILDLSKIEAGQIAIDRGPVDLHSTISECAALHRPIAEKKGLELVIRDCQCERDEARPWVVTDPLRLRQILLNLVGNAVKFPAHGRIEITCRVGEDELTIEVSDTGIGISPARLERIFAPFTQGESDIARRYGGTGLGLTISRQLAELLGGSITVESDPGVGSTFRLALPAVHAEPQFASASEPVPTKPVELAQSARILLVEDHDVNRMLGTEMLERCGQRVEIAHDGNEAIAMVIDSVMRGRPYDLVFMDIQMPGCDGYAATRAIRAEGIGPATMPIIALTANAYPEDIAAARNAGMQAHLAKPLVFADLARTLQRWLPTRIVEAAPREEEAEDTDGVAPGAPPRDDQERERLLEAMKSQIVDASHNAEQPASHATTPVAKGPRLAASTPGSHSPALIHRWNQRRSEAIEAVRDVLASGSLGDGSASVKMLDDLARLVHKLAGTAAIFGEPELGDQAAAFERALRQNLPGKIQEALAFELLSVADDPADTFASTGS